LFLGVLQGLTEFLPVSSSGHLVLAETFLQLPIAERDLLGFDVLLHAATALALLLCYAKMWWKIGRSAFVPDPQHRRLLGLLILATIPGAVAGVLLDDWIAEYTRSVTVVAIALMGTATMLILSAFGRGNGGVHTISVRQAMMIGVAQACALVPGLSRSGLTISVGQLSGLARREALDFSFLMAFPIIVGASAMTGIDVLRGEVQLPPLFISITGFIASFVVSILAIFSLRRFVVKFSLAWFALYLFPAAIALLVASRGL
jgi:undecaprenyl-diphosphatase